MKSDNNSQLTTGSSSNSLRFTGIFAGRESEIRITADNKVCVYDFLKVVGGATSSDAGDFVVDNPNNSN